MKNLNEQDYETYELVLKDEEDEVFALSLVENPAIQSNFVWLNKEGKEEIKFAEVDGDKHLIVGPILIPDTKIIRVNEDTGLPYWVKFSKDTVRQIAQKYIKDGNQHNVTLEHQRPTDGVTLVESWIVDSVQYDKSKLYGLKVKPGSWVGVFKVDNPQVWSKVKDGSFKGISLEGIFSHVLVNASAIELGEIFEKDIEKLSDVEANLVLSKLRNILKSDNRYRKGQRVDVYDMEGAQPAIQSSYAGQFGPGKKRKGEYVHPALIKKTTLK
jgi:hypothetical protein